MNCFQKIVSLIFWTTHAANVPHAERLWIAFKKLYLWYSEQQIGRLRIGTNCCELLSKNCIFDILNNWGNARRTYGCVVNCFQKIVSLIFWTTIEFNPPNLWWLWIAFKKLYLWYSEQLISEREIVLDSCELLSKNCIFDILNNSSTGVVNACIVVNCFQKIVSLIFWTTKY